MLSEAREFALQTLDGIQRGNGKPFIEHPENVVAIARDEIGLPDECLAAVYLHEATRMVPEAVIPEGKFGKDVLTIVDGLNKIATIKPRDTRLEADIYRKLIVSYSTDPRVAVLKLADRLEVMRSLDIFPKPARERKVLETLMLYIPLAHQLGLYNMKSEMEGIYFSYAEPEQYRLITNKLKATEKDRIKLTEQFIKPLEAKLDAAGIRYKVKARTKTAFSIWKKMQKQGVDFDGVYDVFAMRFVIHPNDCSPIIKDGEMLEGLEYEHALCWKVFSYVTEKYESDTKRLRDWITHPKPNGYESLHITVKNEDGAPLEVQIRTDRMDENAESGLASHWSYKGIRHQGALDGWLKAVRESLEHGKKDPLSPPDYEGEDDLPTPPENEIFVFTPNGDLRQISAGATLLDFAFEIHTNLGIKCTGGKINGKAVSFREKLHTGDTVEIFSAKNQKPTADWLNWVVTSKARTKIKQKLKEEEFKKASEGKELLDRRLKNWKLELMDEDLALYIKKHQLKTVNAFYAAIGEGLIDVAEIKDFILSKGEPEHHETVQDARVKGEASLVSRSCNDDIMIIDSRNIKMLDYKMAKCCNPVFGDEVFGIVTVGQGLKIHRMTCPNAARLLERCSDRIQKVKWSDTPATSTFQTSLKIVTEREQNVINDIMATVSAFRASIRNLNIAGDDKHGTWNVTIKVSVSGSGELDKVVSQLKIIKFVKQVTRL